MVFFETQADTFLFLQFVPSRLYHVTKLGQHSRRILISHLPVGLLFHSHHPSHRSFAHILPQSSRRSANVSRGCLETYSLFRPCRFSLDSFFPFCRSSASRRDVLFAETSTRSSINFAVSDRCRSPKALDRRTRSSQRSARVIRSCRC